MKYDAPKAFKILSTILTSTGGNSTYPKVAVQCSADTFVVNQSLVLRMKICGKNHHLRVAANHNIPLLR
jgi:NADP-dependent 3-hydroxy acid dehydrogenase YdfG